MRLSKKTLIFMIIGILAIALALLGRQTSQSLEERSKAEQQLSMAQTRLQGLQMEQLTAQRAQLEEQVAQIAPLAESAKVAFSKKITSIAVASIVFEAASANKLVVTELASSIPVIENLEEARFLTISTTAKVSGDISNVSGFISALNQAFATGVVKSVSINVPVSSGTDNVSTTVQFIIYNQR